LAREGAVSINEQYRERLQKTRLSIRTPKLSRDLGTIDSILDDENRKGVTSVN